MRTIILSILAVVISLTIFSCENATESEKQEQPSVPTLVYPAELADIVDTNIELNWNASTDVNGDVIEYTVYYNTAPTNWIMAGKTKDTRYTLSLEENNVYYWYISASDGETYPVDSESRVFKITSSNTEPTASFVVNPESGTVETTYQFDASGCHDEQDDASLLQVRWDFDGDGSWDTDWNTDKMATHQFSDSRIYNAKMVVRDTEGLEMIIIRNVSVLDVTVTFPDANLEKQVRKVINKPTGPIYSYDVDKITTFEAKGLEIADISGMEYFTSLESLDFSYSYEGGETYNYICDISPLAELKNLRELILSDNPIDDVSYLANLTELSQLFLFETKISNITPLSNLNNLTELGISNEVICDLTPLSNLSSLTKLYVVGNQLSDLSPLSNLTNLTLLAIWESQITDISPLSNLTNLTDLHFVDCLNLSDFSPLSNLTNLTYLWINRTSLSDFSPFASLINLTRLDIYSNKINDISPLINFNNNIEINLGYNQICDLSPLANAAHITKLSLSDNQISDLSPLSNLTNLTYLSLGRNQIKDFAPLSNLTNLTDLYLHQNQIRDISPLINFNSNVVPNLGYNQISDLSPLANATHITKLHLHNNQISDLSPLSNLTNLTNLWLPNNLIEDFSPIANLANLIDLGLSDNLIKDITSLSNLTNLEDLSLKNNQINDILPLVQNAGIGYGDIVRLSGNPLNSPSVTNYIPQLRDRGVLVIVGDKDKREKPKESLFNLRGNLEKYIRE